MRTKTTWERLTRIDTIELELLIDIGFLLLDVGGAVDGARSHNAECDAAITGVSNAANKIQALYQIDDGSQRSQCRYIKGVDDDGCV